jgi:hypothetical protein
VIVCSSVGCGVVDEVGVAESVGLGRITTAVSVATGGDVDSGVATSVEVGGAVGTVG